MTTRHGLRQAEHLLIQHTPKTGGAAFRSIVFQEAARHGQTVQTHYAGNPHGVGSPPFDAAHPAQVIMGHSVNFHMLQPVASGHSVRYVTMVRSPLAWVLSHDCVGMCLSGASTAEQLRANAAALRLAPLDADLMARLGDACRQDCEAYWADRRALAWN